MTFPIFKSDICPCTVRSYAGVGGAQAHLFQEEPLGRSGKMEER